MATALVSEERTHRRAVTMLTAYLSVGNSRCPAKIRNLSARGGLVQTAASAEIGAAVVLSRGPRRAAGEVRWRGTDCVGIWFHEPINVADWLQKDSGSTGSAGKRSPNSEYAEAKNLPAETIACRVREELAYIARLIEGVAELLSEDAILRVRHAARIQELCTGEQMLHELTAILELGYSADAVQTNATGPMRQRLLRARMVGVASCP